ncbi:MAG: phosphate/phosphite/phosphonate ABC transporter substrate-binding protein [Chloroflexi bacterium]|nr:phosphate/phosphite/phosphonate ABC transporter substrate-binding protein [Chloroflexota bacterium]
MRSIKLITVYCLLMTGLAACNLPTAVPAATFTPAVTSTPTPTSTPAPTPKPPLGSNENPILLALPPSQFLDSTAVGNGQTLAGLLEEQTGYRVVAVAPTTYAELIESLRVGNAHIAALPPYAIVKAYQREAVKAAYASTQDGAASYGAQIVARKDRFTPFYDPTAKTNLADAPDALAQFSGKKGCWTEPDSASGYLVPLGILNWFKIPTEEGAFLQSHFSVVRAVRVGEICDFGGTYIDARTYPALKDEYPFIMDEVTIIWEVPPIIPYDGIFLSKTVPDDVSANLKRALDLIFATDDGKTLFDELLGFKGMILVEDIFYVEFTRVILASPANFINLVH